MVYLKNLTIANLPFHTPNTDRQKHGSLSTFTLDNAMLQIKMNHASFNSILTYETIPEEEESCVSDYSLTSSKTKPIKKVHFGYIRTYKMTNGADPPGEHSYPSTCDCGYSPKVLCSVDDIAFRPQSRGLHKKDLRLLQITKAQFTKKTKHEKELPSRPMQTKKRSKPVTKEQEQAKSHFLVVKAQEDGSPDLWTRNSQCNQVKHNQSSFSTNAIHLVYEGNNSKSNLSLPTRLRPADPMTGRKDNVSKR